MYFGISKKTRYALVALCELVYCGVSLPINARKLAAVHQLPVRFLEIILNELKQGGFVQSVRGKAGGYVLARRADQITVAEILTFLESRPVESSELAGQGVPGQFVINSLIRTANEKVAELLGQCTLDEMAQREMQHRVNFESNYVI